MFRAFALRTNHLKHRESMLWLVKLATDAPSVVRATDFARFTLDELSAFDNQEQRSVYWQGAYLLGRSRLALGKPSEAIELFSLVDARSPFHDRAAACATVARQH
jgi:hypothetical protein